MTPDPCRDCEVDALRRIFAARDLLDFALWGEADALRCVESAQRGLVYARRSLIEAGLGGGR